MNDLELDALVSRSTPITQDRADRLRLSTVESDLMHEILATGAAVSASDREPRWRRSSRWIGAAAAAVVVVAVAVGVQQFGRDDEHAWAAPVLAVAEASPRILLDGWEVTRVDEFAAGFGDTTFGGPDGEVDLSWSPDYTDRRSEWVSSLGEPTRVEVLDTSGELFGCDGDNECVLLWEDGDDTIELRGDASTRAEFDARVASLRKVDVDTWLSAMPDSVVRPESRPAVAREMLADVPLPPGFDIERVERGDAVRDRYQVGVQVVKPVVCGWITAWIQATDAGDALGAQRAVDAMATAREWEILLEMRETGFWPDTVWAYADGIAGDGTVVRGSGSGPRSRSIRTTYENIFDCRG